LDVDWTEDTWVPKISFARFAVPVPRLSPLPLSPVNHRCYSPPSSLLFTSRGARGFTLIEMLVVIAIIAMLAGILLPTLAAVKVKARKAQARAEIQNLVGAITGYESEYSRPPAAPEVEAQINDARPDFTYGTHMVGGTLLKDSQNNDLPSVRNPAPYTYTADNRIVMNVILDRDAFPNVDHKRNPRRNVAFHYKVARGDRMPGLDNQGPVDEGLLRDPFGNPYIITIDMNEDNKCRDAYYSPTVDSEIPGQVIIWSLGPDGKINDPVAGQVPNNTGLNADNILSWKN